MPKPVKPTLKRQVRRALAELKTAISVVALVRAVLTCSIIFLVSLLIMQLVSLKWYYAFVPALPFMMVVIIKTLRRATLDEIESILDQEQVSGFRHVLTTIHDTMRIDNEVVRELHRETLGQLRRIKNSYFIRFGNMAGKIVVVMVLSVLIVGLAAFDVRFLDFTQTVEELKDSRFFGTYVLDDSLLQYEENESGDIYGNESLAELGLEELAITLSPVESEIDISDIQDAERRSFAQERAAREIVASNDASYEENIPKEYRKIVKFYFNEITKGG
ncbi:hypothetical protein GF342_00525 [Candidatus Woesearchaeota archaeon]|nr:hypothetical protein [Candidatus Woesearchaeota archaeon]